VFAKQSIYRFNPRKFKMLEKVEKTVKAPIFQLYSLSNSNVFLAET